MHELDEYYQQKKEMGQRFKQFRELIGKSGKEMEQEANHHLIQEERIKMFEKGAIIPDIIFIQYFTETYGLNLTWLVTGTGNTFMKKTGFRRQKTEDRGQSTEDGGQTTNERREMEL